jgi:hypothetical protein
VEASGSSTVKAFGSSTVKIASFSSNSADNITISDNAQIVCLNTKRIIVKKGAFKLVEID